MIRRTVRPETAPRSPVVAARRHVDRGHATSPDPTEPTAAPAAGPHPTKVERAKAAAEAARAKAEAAEGWLQDLRPRRPSVDLAFCTMERDRTRGARLLAGALAYQFFFWVLPFVLVLVGGLGVLGSADPAAPEDLAKRLGILGFIADSIREAGSDRGHAHLWALAIGLPALYIASVSFVKALTVAHSLIWEIPAPKITRKPVAALTMTGVVVAALASVTASGAIRHQSEGPGLFATLFSVVVMALLWLFVSWHMPRATDRWQELVPGAVVVALCMQLVHLITVYYVSRKVASASSSYGAIGAATGILLALFFLARVLVIGASVNAEVWARKQEAEAAGQATIEGRTSP